MLAEVEKKEATLHVFENDVHQALDCSARRLVHLSIFAEVKELNDVSMLPEGLQSGNLALDSLLRSCGVLLEEVILDYFDGHHLLGSINRLRQVNL